MRHAHHKRAALQILVTALLCRRRGKAVHRRVRVGSIMVQLVVERDHVLSRAQVLGLIISRVAI